MNDKTPCLSDMEKNDQQHSGQDLPAPVRSPLATEFDGGLDAEAFAWWRSFIKPIFIEMRKRGVRSMTIERTEGERCRFVMNPEEPSENTEASHAPPANFRTEMKYITTKNEDGELEMFIFPESVNHAIMAEAVARMRNQMHGDWRRITREVESAGFICDGFCCGKSESLHIGPAPGDTDLLRKVLPNTEGLASTAGSDTPKL